MTAYQLYLLAHLLGAIVWVGAVFLMALLGLRVAAAGDAVRMHLYARDSEWLGLRVYLPANLVVLGSALLLVQEGPWGHGQLWIQLGVAGFGISFLTGALFFGPQWPRVARMPTLEGPGAAVANRRIGRLLVVSGFDLGLLLGIVVDMTVKPSAADRGALALMAALPVLGLAFGAGLARTYSRRSGQTAAGAPAPAEPAGG